LKILIPNINYIIHFHHSILFHSQSQSPYVILQSNNLSIFYLFYIIRLVNNELTLTNRKVDINSKFLRNLIDGSAEAPTLRSLVNFRVFPRLTRLSTADPSYHHSICAPIITSIIVWTINFTTSWCTLLTSNLRSYTNTYIYLVTFHFRWLILHV
jgi:hypothetical protein